MILDLQYHMLIAIQHLLQSIIHILKEMLVISPPDKIKKQFEQSAVPLFKKIKLNLSESQTLAELRDTLLPKLMSGEIRVKDAELEVEAAI